MQPFSTFTIEPEIDIDLRRDGEILPSISSDGVEKMFSTTEINTQVFEWLVQHEHTMQQCNFLKLKQTII